jgi:hypothetical protein
MLIAHSKFITIFELLCQKITRLTHHLRQELNGLPLWVDNGEGGFIHDREKIIFALTHFASTPGLAPQETYRCPGVVAVTQDTLVLLKEVNKIKEAFRAQLKQYHKENEDKKIDAVTAWARHLLAKAGYPGLRLKQVMRNLPFIEYHPRRIAWVQGIHTASKRLSIEESDALLRKVGQGKHIEIQRKKLQRLRRTTPLVKHRKIKSGWVVNISTFKQKNNRSAYESLRASLPIFYLHDPQLVSPLVCFSQTRSQRKPRVDKSIEETPFLPSISVYRHKK